MRAFLSIFGVLLATVVMIYESPVKLRSPAAEPAPDWCQLSQRQVNRDLKHAQPASHWFEVLAVAPGVYAFVEPHQSEEVISYLVLGSQRALLIDTGLGIGDIRGAVADFARDLPITVINTHSHSDHVGGNSDFTHLLAVDSEYGRERSKGLSHDQVSWIVEKGEICDLLLPVGFQADQFLSRPYSISEFVADGSKIDLGDRSLQVIATPGHSPDSICLLDAKNRLLFTGDTFYRAPIYLHLAGSDPKAYFASVEHLAKLATEAQVEWVLPGHNEALLPGRVLTDLAGAARRMTLGTAPEPRFEKDAVIYPFEGFSFKLKAPL